MTAHCGYRALGKSEARDAASTGHTCQSSCFQWSIPPMLASILLNCSWFTAFLQLTCNVLTPRYSQATQGVAKPSMLCVVIPNYCRMAHTTETGA